MPGSKTKAFELPEIETKVALLKAARGLAGLDAPALTELAHMAKTQRFTKGEVIFDQDEPCRHFYLVAQGLVKVSILSPSGLRLTYLLAEPGEPINLVGPFTGAVRSIAAQAIKDSLLLCVDSPAFTRYAEKYPLLFKNIIAILGKAVDSANLRIIDMVEKKVQERLVRVLHTLYLKFGTDLAFTSTELAELTGTTTESTLRALGELRRQSIISSERGHIRIKNPDQLKCQIRQELWL